MNFVKTYRFGAALAGCTGGIIGLLLVLWFIFGSYGFNVLIRHGGTYWLTVNTSSPRLSPSMRLALGGPPTATPGAFEWRTIKEGFDVADLPVLAGNEEVDHILLARIDTARFRFIVRNAPAGDKDLDRWMAQLGAALVVNGSYYSQYGEPDTPVVSDGTLLGPKDYDAKAGAFVTSTYFTGVRDLSVEDWHTAFRGADNAMVSYPLLVSNGMNRVTHSSRWLANRSFIGQDKLGGIVVGTTADAFFSLDRLGRFLLDSPLGLAIVLNLDGGPVACQDVSLNGYERRIYGRWEAEVEGDRVKLLTWPYGTIDMPVVLAVLPK
jgi:hypothetical protein